MFTILPANTVDFDDIELYKDESRKEVAGKLCGLRQQAEKMDASDPYICLSDFVAPKESGNFIYFVFVGEV